MRFPLHIFKMFVREPILMEMVPAYKVMTPLLNINKLQVLRLFFVSFVLPSGFFFKRFVSTCHRVLFVKQFPFVIMIFLLSIDISIVTLYLENQFKLLYNPFKIKVFL